MDLWSKGLSGGEGGTDDDTLKWSSLDIRLSRAGGAGGGRLDWC